MNTGWITREREGEKVKEEKKENRIVVRRGRRREKWIMIIPRQKHGNYSISKEKKTRRREA